MLEGLAEELIGHGVMHPEALVANCCIHNLQLQLARPIKDAIGDGGLENRNAMQLLHSIYDLQGYQDWKQCCALLDEAREYTNFHFQDGIQDFQCITDGDREFAGRFNKVRLFKQFVVIEEEEW